MHYKSTVYYISHAFWYFCQIVALSGPNLRENLVEESKTPWYRNVKWKQKLRSEKENIIIVTTSVDGITLFQWNSSVLVPVIKVLKDGSRKELLLLPGYCVLTVSTKAVYSRNLHCNTLSSFGGAAVSVVSIWFHNRLHLLHYKTSKFSTPEKKRNWDVLPFTLCLTI